MRTRGMLAIFLSMLVLSTALALEAKAASDFSFQRTWAAATAKFKNAFKSNQSASKPKPQQQRPAVTHTAAKPSDRPAPALASAQQSPVELSEPQLAAAAPTRPEPTVTAVTAASMASAAPNTAPGNVKVAAITEAAPKDTGLKRAPEPSRPQSPSRAATAAPPAKSAGFNAFEEMLGYALWPQDYTARFWARGYGDIITALVPPTAVAVANADNSKDKRGRTTRNDNVGNAVAVAGMCSVQTEEQADKTIARLTQALELNDAQRGHLAELRAALAEGIRRGKATCVTGGLPPTPAGRLKVATDGLWVMRDANVLFRTPLASFYATLTSAQKAQWNKAATGAGNSDAKDDTAACSAGGAGLPVDAIEQSVRPTPEQRGGLNTLRQISNDMATYLSGSCPETMPLDPVARLDAAGNRVNALLYAVMLFDQTLTGFYLQLSDQQKETFDKVGGKY